jgi:hypothetical protein
MRRRRKAEAAVRRTRDGCTTVRVHGETTIPLLVSASGMLGSCSTGTVTSDLTSDDPLFHCREQLSFDIKCDTAYCHNHTEFMPSPTVATLDIKYF